MMTTSLHGVRVLGTKAGSVRILTALVSAVLIGSTSGALGAQERGAGPARPPVDFDVGVRKTGAGTLTAGQTATFTLSPFNTGPSPVDNGSGVVVTDVLPANFTAPITANGAGWTCTVAGLTITCAYGGPAVNGHQPLPVITVTAVARGEGRYRNCAEIALKPRDTNTRDNNACVEGEIRPEADKGFDVGIRKRGPEGPLTVGQTATFTLNPHNNGPSSVDGASGVVVTDVLPGNFTGPVTANGAGWTCTVAGLTVTCAYGGSAVGAGQPLPVITITAVAKGEGRYENCAEIAFRPRDFPPRGGAVPVGGEVRDANPRDNRDCIRGEVTPEAAQGFDVSIRKRGPEGPLTVGQTATFTLNPHNNGPSSVDGASGVVVTDVLPGNFTGPITANGAGWTCTVAGLTVTCSYGGSAVGAGQPLPVITITAVAKGEGRYENCAEIAFMPRDGGPRGGAIPVGGGVRDANPRDNRDCIRGEVTPEAAQGYDLSIRKRGPEGPVTAGQTATFTLNPHNNGPSSVDGASGVVVTDVLPANFTGPVTASGAGWTCTVAGLTVTCSYGGSAVGAGQPLPVITITAVAQGEGRYENCAEIAFTPRDGGPRGGAIPVGGGVRDANPRDNRDCIRGEVTPEAAQGYDLSIRKRGPEGPVTVGQTATFTLDPHNNGPSSVDQSTGVQVSDQVPVNFGAPVTANGGPDWNCTVQGLAVTCLYTGGPAGVGPLPTITITAVAQEEGRYENCAEIAFMPRDGGPRGGAIPVGGGVRDANPRDNRDCIRGEVTTGDDKDRYDVSIRKFGGGTVSVGGQVSFTLNPHNNGPGSVASVTVVDSLPAGLTSIIAPSGSPWDCSLSSPAPGSGTQTLTCIYSGSSVGQGPFPAIDIQATAERDGEFTNCAEISLDGVTDANPQDNRDCRAYVVTGPQTGTITIVKDAQPSGPQSFTFTSSPSNLPGFTLDDDPTSANFSHQNVMSGLQAGSYAFTEGTTLGWTLTGVVCTSAPTPGRTIFDRWGNLSIQTVTVELEPGDNIICTFTNVADPAPAAPDLGITKVGVVTETAAGQVITYTIVITNPGGTTPSGTIHLIDLLSGFPAGTIYNSASGVGACSPPVPGTPWDCEVPASNLGLPITIEIVVPPGGGSVTNCATVVLEGDPNNLNNEACVTNTVTPPTAATGTLTIVKDVQPGDHAQDFTFTAVGAGLSDFSLDDDPSSPMPNSVTFTNLALGVPFTVTEDALSPWTVPSLQCYVAVPGLTTQTTDQLNRTFTVTLLDPGANVTCVFINTQTPAPAAPDLGITKVGVVTETAAGQVITYTIVITNPGGTTPSGTIHLIDLLSGFPAGTIYNSASGVGACSPPVPGTPWDCEVPASNLGLPITIEIVVQPGGGSVTNCATVVLEGDPNDLNNEACVTNTIDPPTAATGTLTIVKEVQPGDHAQDFTFTTVGVGLSDFSLDDDPSSSTPSSQTFTNLLAGPYTVTEDALNGWAVSGTGYQGSLNCGHVGPTASIFTPSGNSVTVNLVAGDHVTCTFINTQTPAPAAPDLGITKVGVVTETAAGHLITYTIVISNPGGTTPSGTIHLIDLLSGFPAGTIYNSGSGVGPCSQPTPGTPWDCEVPASNLGLPITIEIVVPPGSGSVTNCATVVLEGDPNDLNNEACVTNTVDPPIVTVCDDGNPNTMDVVENGICHYVEISPSGSITIRKDAQPNDPQDFEFLFVNNTAYSYLDDDDDGLRQDNHVFSGLAGGATYTFSETEVPGWSLTGIVCAPSNGTTVDVTNRSVAVNLASGAAVTCTFTNVLTPPNGSSCDDGNANTVNDAWVNGVCTGTPTGTGTACIDGYGADGPCTGTPTGPGTGTLTIVKDVDPGSDPQDFHFTAVGAGLNDFSLDDDPSSSTPSSVTFTNLALGVPFTVTEDALSPWTVPSLQCYVAVPGLTTQTTDQLNRTLTVTLLDPGANVTCVFMNVR